MIITGYCLSMFNFYTLCMCVLMTMGGINMQGACRKWETLHVIPRHLCARDKGPCYSPLDQPGQLAHKILVVLLFPHLMVLHCSAGITHTSHHIWLYMGSRDKNTGPQAYAPSTFLRELQLLSQVLGFVQEQFLVSRYFLIFLMITFIHTFICK